MKRSEFPPVVSLLGVLSLMFAPLCACRTLEAGSPPKTAPKKEPEWVSRASKPDEGLDWNEAILRAIDRMPSGGGYSVRSVARDALQSAVAWEGGKPAIQPSAAQPSFCSGATYLAWVIALAQEQRAGRVSLAPEVWRKLMVEGQVDGEGVWGRWNANGPGTARLFYELGLGRNFTDWKEARPGDFLKVFWNESIGVSEKGHSVVFLERAMVDQEEMVTFWSSNQPGGYGVKKVPFRNIKRAVFSRLEHPERLSGVGSMPERDEFLAGLISKSAPPQVAAKACGLKGW